MKRFVMSFLTGIAVALVFGCSAPNTNTNTNTNTSIANASTANQPPLETLMDLERKAFDAYKNKDAKFFESLLTDKFVSSSNGRRLDKAERIQAIAGHNCDIKSFSYSEENLTNVGAATAIITMKVTPDGACEGKEMQPFIAAALFVRDNNEWKGAWYGAVTIVDPKAPAKPGDNIPTPTYSTMADSETQELAAVEKSVWEGWMNRDGKKLDSLTARELAFVNIFGGYFKNREETLKNWTESPCEIKSVDVRNPTSVSVSPDTSILMHTGTANGTCFGQPVDPILGTSIYVKDGPAWKLAFTMNMPGR